MDVKYYFCDWGEEFGDTSFCLGDLLALLLMGEIVP
jgi:hypothetical protein